MPELHNLCAGAALLSMPNAEALAVAAALAARRPEGFLDAVPGAQTLLLLYDPDRLDPARLRLPAASEAPRPRAVRLQARYDGEDLDEVARELGASRAEVIRRHTAAEHVVSFLGFAPGFAYMTGGFALPRLPTPRVRVPAGSVAIADGYTGIYPAETPGGWRLLGRVAARMFDPSASPPALLRPGDRVVFEPVEDLAEVTPPVPAGRPGTPLLRLIAPGAFTSVQGGPRYGLLSSGVPAGGAMDLAALAAANRAAGNDPLDAALEITLAGPELEALEDVRVALGTWVRELARGERWQTGPVQKGVRAYLAVGGGLAQPLPGEPTRALRRGEVLHRAPPGLAHQAARPPEIPARCGESRIEVRAHRGPQWRFFAGPEGFFQREYRVSPNSDRRGLRLQGTALALARRSDIPPEGTAPGAVQVPGDGLPIVLGPDRPVTGGYAKIATVVPADFPLLAQARPGTVIRFVEEPWT
ncbi:MAG TPA: urea amidolyase family protein [Myxococcales bacterium]|nr:urea amidolyase family protein [Myxococcales bacterium]